MSLRRAGPLGLVLAIALSWATPVHAQGIKLPGERKGSAEEPIDIRYERFERTEENGTITYVLTGHAEIIKPSMTLIADSVVGWQTVQPSADGKKQKLAFDEMYAEGHVRILRGKEKISADRVYFDNRTDRGLLINAEIRTKKEGLKHPGASLSQGAGDPFLYSLERGVKEMPFVMRAERFRQLDAKTIVAEDGYFTTCEFGEPDYKIAMKEATILRGGTGDSITMRHVVPMGGGLPILYIPYFFFVFGYTTPLRTIGYSNSTRFGTTIRVHWQLTVGRYKRDANGEILRDAHGLPEEQRWGAITLDTNWLSKRGYGFGPGLEYKWANYKGFLKTFYIRDSHNDLSNFDRTTYPFTNDDRGRVHLFHRMWLTDDRKLRMDIEASWLSDRNFLPTYFQQEALEGKEQETYAYLRYLNGNFGMFDFERYRVNEFQTQTEYMPQIGARWISEPLFDGRLYFTDMSEVSDVRLRTDNDLHLDDPMVLRVDSENDLAAPIDLGPVMFTPWVGERVGVFSQGSHRDDVTDRAIFSAGARAFFQAHRELDTTWDLVGLRGLRHTIDLEARYEANLTASAGPGDLVQTDHIDQVGKFEDIYFELRNRLQTKGVNGPSDWFEFLNLGLAVKEYPRPERDTGHFNAQDYLPPMSYITLTADSAGNFSERSFSNLYMDWSLTPRSFFSVTGQAEFETQDLDFVTLNSTVNLYPAKRLRLYATDNYIEQVTHQLVYGLNYQATEKWGLRGWQTFDFNLRTFTQESVGVTYAMHDLVIDTEFRYTQATDDYSVSLLIFPKDVPRLALQTRALDFYSPQQPGSPQTAGSAASPLK